MTLMMEDTNNKVINELITYLSSDSGQFCSSTNIHLRTVYLYRANVLLT